MGPPHPMALRGIPLRLGQGVGGCPLDYLGPGVRLRGGNQPQMSMGWLAGLHSPFHPWKGLGYHGVLVLCSLYPLSMVSQGLGPQNIHAGLFQKSLCLFGDPTEPAPASTPISAFPTVSSLNPELQQGLARVPLLPTIGFYVFALVRLCLDTQLDASLNAACSGLVRSLPAFRSPEPVT